jgi:hypothetical protein
VHVQAVDLGRDLLAGLVGEVDDADPGALGGEAPRARAADAAGRPGDDRDLALQAWCDGDQPPLFKRSVASVVAGGSFVAPQSSRRAAPATWL